MNLQLKDKGETKTCNPKGRRIIDLYLASKKNKKYRTCIQIKGNKKLQRSLKNLQLQEKKKI